jgi:hypothetical protein
MDFETEVKQTLYQMIAQTGNIPDAAILTSELDVPQEDILGAFENLAAKRLLVLEPGNPSKIRMAPPFSGIKTPFRVEMDDISFYANCVWDAFGIAAALHQDGIINASDGYTNEPLILEIKDAKPSKSSYFAHFAVPAAHWWDDIIHT